MAKIQDILNTPHKYKVDLTYQRPVGAWSREDNACLIDTILRGEPMPLFFLNYNTSEDIFYVVDGQQRLHAITQFHQNKVKLSKKFSDETRKKMSDAAKGREPWNKGKKGSQIPWNKGIKNCFSDETKKMSETAKERKTN